MLPHRPPLPLPFISHITPSLPPLPYLASSYLHCYPFLYLILKMSPISASLSSSFFFTYQLLSLHLTYFCCITHPHSITLWLLHSHPFIIPSTYVVLTLCITFTSFYIPPPTCLLDTSLFPTSLTYPALTFSKRPSSSFHLLLQPGQPGGVHSLYMTSFTALSSWDIKHLTSRHCMSAPLRRRSNRRGREYWTFALTQRKAVTGVNDVRLFDVHFVTEAFGV